jgi:hypothetical protein
MDLKDLIIKSFNAKIQANQRFTKKNITNWKMT